MKQVLLAAFFVIGLTNIAFAADIEGKSEVLGQIPFSQSVITIIDGQVVSQPMANIPMSTLVLVESECADLSGSKVNTKKCYLVQPWVNTSMSKKILTEIFND